MNYPVPIPSTKSSRTLSRALMLLLLLCCGPILSAQVTVTSRVNLATDDMEEVISTGAIDGNSSDLELINEAVGDQIIGLRFANLNVPAGAIIVNAYIQFTTDETTSGATSLTFRAQAADSAATFPLSSFSVSGRPLGTASVTWSSIPAWNTLQEQGTSQRTPNLNSLIQEVVDRPAWKAGNAVAVMVTGSGKRVAESYEGATSGSSGHSATQAATLTVQYVMGTTVSVRINNGNDDAEENIGTGAIDLTSSDLELTEDGSPAFQQYIGMRFASVNVPKGAIVASAHLQFVTDETFSDPTSLTIRGQAADNPATFTSSASNISSRPLTTAGVSWAPVPWTVLQEAGPKQRTPDMASIIQEIINRAGWSQGNAMVIRINGSGHRTAEAYNGSAGEAPLLVIRYYTLVPPVAPIGSFPVPKNAVWKYLDNGADPGTAWRDSAYNDSTWAFGPAQLGYGDGDEARVVGFGPSSGNKYITTYFRHTFMVSDLNRFDSLRVQLMRDDGAVVYLNGNEIVRSNMPGGNITSATRAAATVGGADESAYFTFMVGREHLVAGKNVLAVEVHQDAPSSSDISFAMSLEGKKNDVKLIATGSGWEYNDNGTYPGENWYTEAFSSMGWSQGLSPLGYGNGNEGTTLGYGTNAAEKYPAAYFRRSFVVTDTAGLNSLLLRLRRDDGAIVYLNGVELLRSNMPAGMVDNMTLAPNYVEGSAENEFLSFYINRNLLRIGSNLIAVEVHQNSRTSTDLAFDLELIQQEATNPLTPLGKGTPVACNSGTIGCFTSVIPTAQQQTLVIPPTHTFQVLVKSGRDRYTGTSTALPGGNDFTGFIPHNGNSSTLGHLSINHENTPGGVTMLDMHYDQTSRLWSVDTITPINFSQVVTTSRNCSGGITPWGTVITSEETYSTGDANADGYHDVGWNVEIDPRTRRVRDLDRDGKADKLWMTGRMSHENVCVLNDSVTLYQGEDGGTGCVYKFVAAQKGRLDSGALYVLRRDGPTATTGRWIRVPNATRSDRNTVSTVAGALGGTRWGGVEDVEVGPDGKLYFTEKGRGDTWRFRDDGDSVAELELYISNRSYAISTEMGTVNESWGTGNDNLAFDNEGNLWVLQDGGRNHLWMVHRDHTPANPKVSLFATTPAGGEPTGITFSPDNRFIFLSIQHPNGTNTAVQIDAAGDTIVFNQAATIVIARKEHLGPGAIAPALNIGRDTMICEGSTLRLTYSNPDATPVWYDNSANTALDITHAGRYWVTAIGNNGQIARDSITVLVTPRPEIDLGPDRSFCEGESFNVSLDPGFTYMWDDGSRSGTRSINRTGTYRVTAINREGCSVSDTIALSFLPASRPNLGSDRRICRGGSVTLNVPGFVSYQWSTGATGPGLTISEPGTYWVKGMNLNGCALSDTVVVTMSGTTTLGNDLSICNGGSATLTPGTGYASYLWNDGSTGASLRATAPGRYWVRVTDDGGCQSSDTLTVALAPEPTVNLGADTVICPTCSITLDAGAGHASYLWSTGATTRTITVNQAGDYAVTVQSAEGCPASDDIDIVVDVVAGVEEIASNDRFSVGAYPNPFTADVTVRVDLKSSSRLLVEIYDIAGRRLATLKDGTANTGRHEFKVDGEKLGGSGVYMLKVSAGGREVSRKLVRQ